jgi:sugar-phosphatase
MNGVAPTATSELRVAALISDMDGVLVDTGGIYDRHWQRWAERHGISAQLIGRVHFGRPATETIRLVAPHMDAQAEARRFNDELADDPTAAGVSAMPGALRLAAALPSRRWAIATSAPRVMAERWLAHVGMSLPAVIVTVDDVTRGKPAPDPYLRAAELLGVDVAACLVIEDAPAGITAAKAAGATVLGVLSTHASAELAEADHLVADLAAVAVRPVEEGSALEVSWQAVAR